MFSITICRFYITSLANWRAYISTWVVVDVAVYCNASSHTSYLTWNVEWIESGIFGYSKENKHMHAHETIKNQALTSLRHVTLRNLRRYVSSEKMSPWQANMTISCISMHAWYGRVKIAEGFQWRCLKHFQQTGCLIRRKNTSSPVDIWAIDTNVGYHVGCFHPRGSI